MDLEQTVLAILVEVYGDRKAKRKLPIHMKVGSRGFNLRSLVERYGHEEALRKMKARLASDRTKGTLKGYILRYGDVEGPALYYEKNKKLSVGVDTLRRKGLSEGEIAAIKSNHAAKSKHNLDNFVSLYGDQGVELFDDWKSTTRERSHRCVEFYTSRGFTIDQASMLITKLQTHDYEFLKARGWTDDEYIDLCQRKTQGITLQGYQQRYGLDEGAVRYKYDRQKGSLLAHYIEKYGEVDGHKIYNSTLQRRTAQSRDSEIQKEFAQLLYGQLKDDIKQLFCGQPLTNNYFINYTENKFGLKCSIPDIRIKNILIEFDGSYWHSLPENQERDKQKDILNTALGYTTIRVDEAEYRENKNQIIDSVINQITQLLDVEFKHTFKDNQ